MRLWIDLNETKGGLDSDDKTTENTGMEIRGRVHNGVVVLEGELPLPEGTEVIVSSGAAPETKPVGEQRIEFPLVRSKHPGSLRLTGQRVAEFLRRGRCSCLTLICGWPWRSTSISTTLTPSVGSTACRPGRSAFAG